MHVFLIKICPICKKIMTPLVVCTCRTGHCGSRSKIKNPLSHYGGIEGGGVCGRKGAFFTIKKCTSTYFCYPVLPIIWRLNSQNKITSIPEIVFCLFFNARIGEDFRIFWRYIIYRNSQSITLNKDVMYCSERD